MLNFIKSAAAHVSNEFKKVGRRLKTFGKHKKEEGLPRYVESYQEYLKNAPKDFRRYDRKSKMYLPSIPRGKERKQSEAFQEFIAQTLEYSNTNPTYQELSIIQRNLEQSEFYEQDISLNDAYEILEEQEAIEEDIEVSTGTNQNIRENAVDDMIERYKLPESAKATLRSVVHKEIMHGDTNNTYKQLEQVIKNWYPAQYNSRRKLVDGRRSK